MSFWESIFGMKSVRYGGGLSLNREGRWVKTPARVGGKLVYLLLAIIIFSVLMILLGGLMLVIGIILFLSVFFVPLPWNWRIMFIVAGLIFIWLGLL